MRWAWCFLGSALAVMNVTDLLAASQKTQNGQSAPVQAPVRRAPAPIQRQAPLGRAGVPLQQRNVRGGPVGGGARPNHIPTANRVPTFSPSLQGGRPTTTVGAMPPPTPGRFQFTPVSPPAAGRGSSAALRTPRPGVVDASPRGAAVHHDLAKPAGLQFDRAHRIGRAGLSHHHTAFVFRHEGHRFRRAYYRHGDVWFWFDVPLPEDDPAFLVDDAGVPECDPSADMCGPPVEPVCDPSTGLCGPPIQPICDPSVEQCE